MTVGLDVFVQEVIAAMATEPVRTATAARDLDGGSNGGRRAAPSPRVAGRSTAWSAPTAEGRRSDAGKDSTEAA